MNFFQHRSLWPFRWRKIFEGFDKLFAWADFYATRTRRKLERFIETARKGIPHCLEPKSVQLTFDQLETRMCMSTMQFTAASYSVLQSASSLTVNVSISSTATASVNYATSDLTAATGTDYTSESGTLNFTSGGSTTQSFNVPILNDSLYSANLTFALTLSSPSGATLGTNSYDIVTIDNTTSGGFSLFNVPSGSGSQPFQIVADGSNLYFTESGSGKIGKVTETGSFTEYAIASGYTPVALTLGPDGNIWYTSWYYHSGRGGTTQYGDVSKITSGGTISNFNLGTDIDLPSIISSDGDLVVADEDEPDIFTVSTSGGASSDYYLPDDIVGMTNGADGNLWITDPGDEELADTRGTYWSYHGLPAGSDPQYIVSADGDLWFTDDHSYGGFNAVGRFSLTGQVTMFLLPTSGADPQGIVAAPDGSVWVAETGANQIAQITPNGQVIEYGGLPAGGDPTDLAFGADGNLYITLSGTGQIAKFVGLSSTYVRSTDANQGFTDTFGPTQVSPNTGSFSLSHAMSLNQSPANPVLGGSPALVFNSADVDVQPIVEATFASDPNGSVPTDIYARLDWNGGGYSSWTTFSTSGHSAGDTYALALQVPSTVTASGLYPYSIEIKATYSGSTELRVVNGDAIVIVEGSTDPFGEGWSLAGLNQLIPVSGGMLLYWGASGTAEYFAADSRANGDFISPPNDFGTLVENGGGTYTYTDTGNDLFNFSSSGYEATIVDPYGFTRTFLYDGSNRMTAIQDPDGSTATFTYGSYGLSTITAPGSRTVTVNVNSSINLVSITDPGGGVESFTYNGSDQMTTETFAPLPTATFSYNGNGTLASIAYGSSDSLTVASANNVALATSPAVSLSSVTGTLTDALSRVTSYTLDQLGRIDKLQTPDGSTQTWTRDFAGQPSTYTDGLGNTTTYSYKYGLGAVYRSGSDSGDQKAEAPAGSLAEEILPTGAVLTYTYEGNIPFPMFAESTNADGNSTSYNIQNSGVATGEFAGDYYWTLTNGAGNTTTYFIDPSTGLLAGVQDADSNIVVFTYDSANRVSTITVTNGMPNIANNGGLVPAGVSVLLTEIDPGASSTSGATGQTSAPVATGVYTFTYDGAGNESTLVVPLGSTTTMAYNAMGQEVSVTQANASVATTLYDAYGNVTETIDGDGHATVYDYSSSTGLEISQTVAYGTSIAATTTYLYDAVGNMTGQVNPLGNLTEYLYDSVGNLTETINPLGDTQLSYYDLNGNLTGQTDGNGNLTQNFYDANGNMTGTKDPLGNLSSTYYDAGGNVTGQKDPNGNLTQTFYDANENVTGTQDPLGYTTETYYDAAGNTTGQRDADGDLTQYSFDGSGQYYTTIDPLGHSSTTLYDANGNATGQTDNLGNLSESYYDGAGQLTGTRDALGNLSSTYYDPAGNVTGQTDSLGDLTKTYYDAQNRVTEVINPLGDAKFTYYDLAGHVTGTQDGNGNLTQYLFDADGRQTVVIDPLGDRTTSLYDADAHVTETINALGDTAQYLYDADGRLTVTIDALGNRATSLYDADGHVTETIDARGNTTQYLFDADGRQTVVIDALGDRTTTLYDGDGHVTETINPLGNTTQYLYDADGRQTVVIDALGDRSTTLYDADAHVTETIDARGNVTQYMFDADGRQTVTIDALGDRTTTLYDADGQATEVINAVGNATYYLYDADGRQSVTIDPLGERTTSLYDANGNMTGQSDGDGHLTQYLFDALNRLTVTVDALGDRTTQLLDALGNLTEMIDADNNVTTFAYNADNQMVSETNPLGYHGSFAYDADGDLSSTTDYDGRVITYAYDTLDRETGETWHSGNGSSSVTNVATFTYNSVGNELTAANYNGAYTMSYDALGRVTVVQELGWATLTFLYDAAGNRTVVEDSFGGIQTSGYDADNRLDLEAITGPAGTQLQIDLTYTPDGQLSAEYRYNTVGGPGLPVGVTSYLYDAADRVTDITALASSTVLTSYTYLYDAASNLTQEVDNGTLVTYAYNADNELTSAGAATYSYDATGNRTNTGYSTGADNELLSNGVWTYAYDAAGNETGKTNISTGEQWTYSYDDKGEMVSAVDVLSGARTTVTYEYDAFGNRIEQSVATTGGTTTTKYAMDGWDPALKGQTGNSNWNVWADLTSSGTMQTRYLRGDQVDQLFANIGSSGTAAFLLADHLESIVGTTNSSGTLEDVITYDAYGNITNETAPSWGGTYKYTGQELDVSTGLQYTRARYYDSTTGRWLSQDPTAFSAGDTNLYRYVANQPEISTDPSGLQQAAGNPFAVRFTYHTQFKVLNWYFKVQHFIGPWQAIAIQSDLDNTLPAIKNCADTLLALYNDTKDSEPLPRSNKYLNSFIQWFVTGWRAKPNGAMAPSPPFVRQVLRNVYLGYRDMYVGATSATSTSPKNIITFSYDPSLAAYADAGPIIMLNPNGQGWNNGGWNRITGKSAPGSRRWVLTLGPRFFACTPTFQCENLIHEFSHMFAGTFDFAFCGMSLPDPIDLAGQTYRKYMPGVFSWVQTGGITQQDLQWNADTYAGYCGVNFL